MLSDYEATQVMFFISCHDQDSPVVNHLYELHKLRDRYIGRCLEIQLEEQFSSLTHPLREMNDA